MDLSDIDPVLLTRNRRLAIEVLRDTAEGYARTAEGMLQAARDIEALIERDAE